MYKFSNISLEKSYSYAAPPKVALFELRPELVVEQGPKYHSEACSCKASRKNCLA